jgi:tetratricopeptide (TPR) repeat protein
VGYDFPGPPCGSGVGKLALAPTWLTEPETGGPGRTTSNLVAGQAAWLLGDCAEAVERWLNQDATGERQPLAAFLAARGLYALGRTEEAIPYFQQSHAADLIQTLAMTRLVAGATEEAIRLFELAFAIQPDVKKAAQLAERYRASGQSDRAAKIWQSVADHTTEDQADHWQARAEIADLAGQKAEARAALERAVALTEDPYPLFLRLGRVLMQMEAWPEALAVYEKAVALQPRASSEPYTQTGLIYAQLGNYPVAMDWFDRGAAASPHDPWPHIFAGDTAQKFGDMVEAEKRLAAVVQRYPEHYGALYAWAMFLQRQDRLQEAVTVLEKIAGQEECGVLRALVDDYAKLKLTDKRNATSRQVEQHCP